MAKNYTLNEDALMSSLDAGIEDLIEHFEYEQELEHKGFVTKQNAIYEKKLKARKEKERREQLIAEERQKALGRRGLNGRPQVSLVKEEYLGSTETEMVDQKPATPIDAMASSLSNYVSLLNKNKVNEDVVKTPEEQRFDKIEQRLDKMSRSIVENTIVSGIGQGGDGQTPGSGEVRLNRLDDVDMNGLENGQSLVWDREEGKWKPGSSAGGGDVIVSPTPPTGDNIQIGDLWFNEGDLTLNIWTGDEWITVNGATNTREVALVNALPVARQVYADLTGIIIDPADYQTQEDYNILVARMIQELDIIKPTMTVDRQQPEYAMEGDLWLDMDSYYMFIWDGNAWVQINGPKGQGGDNQPTYIDGGTSRSIRMVDDNGLEVTITPSLIEDLMHRIRVLEEKLGPETSNIVTE